MRRAAVFASLLVLATLSAEPAKAPRETLKPLNILVGSWKGTGTPEGSPDERQKGHWTETVAWEWQFKGDDAWLGVTFDKGKFFARGELRPAGDKLELKLTTVD